MKRLKPGPKTGARAAHRLEALRFCMAGMAGGWTPERTSELCVAGYGISATPGMLRDLFAAFQKASEKCSEEFRTINDLGIALEVGGDLQP